MPVNAIKLLSPSIVAATAAAGLCCCSAFRAKVNCANLSALNSSTTFSQGADSTENSWLINLLKTWLPFINEAAGVLEHSGLKMFKGIYKANSIQRMLIDAVALSSMLWNTADEADEKDSRKGLWKGLGLLGFSFIAPTYLMNPIVEGLAKLKFAGGIMNKPIGRLASGIALIWVLEACVKLWDDKIVPFLEKTYHKSKALISSFGQSISQTTKVKWA